MRKIEPDKISNILVVRNDRFGEFLLNIPAWRALKETFKGARIIALIDPYVRGLAQGIDFIDEIIDWEKKEHSLKENISLIRVLRRKKVDIAVIFNPSKESNFLAYLSGIPVRAGYNRKCAFLLTHRLEDRKFLGEKHEIEYNLELVSLLGAGTKNKELSLRVDEDIPASYGLGTEGGWIVIHPFTSDPIKQWPFRFFKELMQKLSTELNIKVVVVGGGLEQSNNKELFSGFAKNVVDLTGKTSLSQLAAILKKSMLLISGDSGPVHLASCVGLPVVAIFRNDIAAKGPVRWGPRSDSSVILEKNNLEDITVSEVFNKVKGVLNK
jgi:ADP-heptose:LPS heptosyltransferase